jgi:hypothetical protein
MASQQVYGNAPASATSICPPKDPLLTPDNLVAYVTRSKAILADMLAAKTDVAQENAIARLNIIRQEIAFITETPFVNLPFQGIISTRFK